MRVLVCTDGSPSSEQGAVLVDRLGLADAGQVTLLAVAETEEEHEKLNEILARMLADLGGARPGLETKIVFGYPPEMILAEVEDRPFDLVVVGAHGRRGLTRFKTGSTTGRLARELHLPLLVARNVPDRIRRILICTGAEAPSMETLKVGAHLASHGPAEVTLLHVMSQIALQPESTSEELFDSAEEAMERGTREGLHFQEAIRTMRAIGVTAEITARLRYGLVVDEILSELGGGRYDLLVIGAHRRPGLTRWLEIMLDDVADHLLSHAPCSVLVVRPPDIAQTR
jgi:nucleotide-binding universal stress UspA family protein